MTLIERLRKGIVTSAPYEPMYTVPPAAINLEAANALERLTAEEKMQLEQICNQGLEIDRLSKEVKDLRDEVLAGDQDIERLTAELEATKKAVQQNYFRVVEVTVERDALKADAERYRWLRRDDIEYRSQTLLYEMHTGEDLDAAIDSAIQGAKT